MIGLDHLDDPDDPLLVDRMIEEPAVTDLHGLHVVGRLVVADPVPAFAFVTLAYLVVPRPGARPGLEQPVRHRSVSLLAPGARHPPPGKPPPAPAPTSVEEGNTR